MNDKVSNKDLYVKKSSIAGAVILLQQPLLKYEESLSDSEVDKYYSYIEEINTETGEIKTVLVLL